MYRIYLVNPENPVILYSLNVLFVRDKYRHELVQTFCILIVEAADGWTIEIEDAE